MKIAESLSGSPWQARWNSFPKTQTQMGRFIVEKLWRHYNTIPANCWVLNISSVSSKILVPLFPAHMMQRARGRINIRYFLLTVWEQRFQSEMAKPFLHSFYLLQSWRQSWHFLFHMFSSTLMQSDFPENIGQPYVQNRIGQEIRLKGFQSPFQPYNSMI